MINEILDLIRPKSKEDLQEILTHKKQILKEAKEIQTMKKEIRNLDADIRKTKRSF